MLGVERWTIAGRCGLCNLSQGSRANIKVQIIDFDAETQVDSMFSILACFREQTAGTVIVYMVFCFWRRERRHLVLINGR
jgi:hypothetical protein